MGLFDPNDKWDEVAAKEIDRPIQIVRNQFAESNQRYHEERPGVFRCNGITRGAGFAEALVVVNVAEGTASVDINTHLRTDPNARDTTRRFIAMLNESYIVPGFRLDDMCVVHFTPPDANILAGDDVDDLVGKGFSSVHGDSHKFTALAAGSDPWTLL